LSFKIGGEGVHSQHKGTEQRPPTKPCVRVLKKGGGGGVGRRFPSRALPDRAKKKKRNETPPATHGGKRIVGTATGVRHHTKRTFGGLRGVGGKPLGVG